MTLRVWHVQQLVLLPFSVQRQRDEYDASLSTLLRRRHDTQTRKRTRRRRTIHVETIDQPSTEDNDDDDKQTQDGDSNDDDANDDDDDASSSPNTLLSDSLPGKPYIILVSFNRFFVVSSFVCGIKWNCTFNCTFPHFLSFFGLFTILTTSFFYFPFLGWGDDTTGQHYGPAKTGTSTLQNEMSVWKDRVYELDNVLYGGAYYVPGQFMGRLALQGQFMDVNLKCSRDMARARQEWHSEVQQSQPQQSSSSSPTLKQYLRDKVPCFAQMLDSLDAYHKNGTSLFFSNEIKSTASSWKKLPGYSHFVSQDWQTLAETIGDEWNFLLIVGHRPFLDWVRIHLCLVWGRIIDWLVSKRQTRKRKTPQHHPFIVYVYRFPVPKHKSINSNHPNRDWHIG